MFQVISQSKSIGSLLDGVTVALSVLPCIVAASTLAVDAGENFGMVYTVILAACIVLNLLSAIFNTPIVAAPSVAIGSSLVWTDIVSHGNSFDAIIFLFSCSHGLMRSLVFDFHER